MPYLPRMPWPTFENVNPEHIAVLRNAFGSLMKSAKHLAAYISAHIERLSLDGVRYEQAYLWAIAQEFDDELFGVTEHTGPLTDWAQRLGLRAGDSTEFRRYLVQNGIMKTVSKNIRGRSRDSISHALIYLPDGCKTGE